MVTTESEQKIKDIIIEVWTANNSCDEITDFNLWVSYIMCYGYDYDDIIEVAKKYKIKHIPEDCDPDDKNDVYGALELTKTVIKRLEKRKTV